ncbi:hypothetical protein K8I61_06950, partial [bacterium]|nr:hypothetical protein [bacterium]
AAIADDDLPPDLPADPQARFLAFVRAKDLGLWAHAGHGEVTVDGDLVRIAAPKGMHFDALTEEKGALGEAARAAFGDDARVEIAIGERRQDDRRKAENERREEEAAVRRRVLDDPGVTLLQQTFPEATITVVPEKR